MQVRGSVIVRLGKAAGPGEHEVIRAACLATALGIKEKQLKSVHVQAITVDQYFNSEKLPISFHLLGELGDRFNTTVDHEFAEAKALAFLMPQTSCSTPYSTTASTRDHDFEKDILKQDDEHVFINPESQLAREVLKRRDFKTNALQSEEDSVKATQKEAAEALAGLMRLGTSVDLSEGIRFKAGLYGSKHAMNGVAYVMLGFHMCITAQPEKERPTFEPLAVVKNQSLDLSSGNDLPTPMASPMPKRAPIADDNPVKRTPSESLEGSENERETPSPQISFETSSDETGNI